MYVRASGIPNMGTCISLYRSGFMEPVARACGAAPGDEASTGPVAVDAGTHHVVVEQDRTPLEDGASFVYENVSDPYRLSVTPADP